MPDADFWEPDRFDQSDTHRLEAALLDSKATGIINAAAYTAVDRAESKPDVA
jgi:dTDP-4-dehydrorhamnose reductase